MSNSITPGIALIFFVIIIVVAIIISLVVNPARYEHSRTHTFLATLVGLGIFVTFLFYYSVVELQQEQIELFSVQETARISTSLLESIFTRIENASTSIPNFTASLLPLMICSAPMPGPDPETPEACTAKYTLSYQIFTAFQDIILSNNFVAIEPLAYVSNFLQRTNSPQLYEQWKINKIDFNTKTQQFGDLLFEYGLPITEQVPIEYTAAAKNLIADPRYIALFP